MAKGIDRKSNPALVGLIHDLKAAGREGAPVWRDIATRLSGPSRHWAQVNISKIELHVRDGENVIVPGKVLGSGDVGKPLTIIAFNASASAKAKIAAAGGKVLTLKEGLSRFPKGEQCRIIG